MMPIIISRLVRWFELSVLLLWGAACAYAADRIEVLKIDPTERTAAVRTEEGTLDIIHEGDEIETLGKVISISDRRIVLKNSACEIVMIEFIDGVQSVMRAAKKDGTAQHPAPKSTFGAAGEKSNTPDSEYRTGKSNEANEKE